MDGAGCNGLFRRSLGNQGLLRDRCGNLDMKGRGRGNRGGILWGAKITPRRKKMVLIITIILCGCYFYYRRYQIGAAQAKGDMPVSG